LSRFENKILGNQQGLQALDGVLQRSIDPLLKREGKARLILDLDSSEVPAHGRQEGVNYNGHFRKNCYHPLFCFTSSGICLAGKLREGNVHSAHGALEMLSPIVERYRSSGSVGTLPLPSQSSMPIASKRNPPEKSTPLALVTGRPLVMNQRNLL
jgi:hypothetical protein